MLILEIVLSIFAWNRGWKWKGLIPLGAALVLGFIVGFISASVDMNTANALIDSPYLIVGDIIVVLILILMIIKKPKKEIENKTEDSVGIK